MKTENQIYDDYCEGRFSEPMKTAWAADIKNTFGFQKYVLLVRFHELIEEIKIIFGNELNNLFQFLTRKSNKKGKRE
jgi:hypothetical protein